VSVSGLLATGWGAAVWVARGLVSMTPAGIDSFTSTSSGTVASTSVPIPAWGFAVYGRTNFNTGSTMSWSGATERLDLKGDLLVSAADTLNLTANATQPNVASTSGDSRRAMVAASFAFKYPLS
jgi:hypothetical protein